MSNKTETQAITTEILRLLERLNGVDDGNSEASAYFQILETIKDLEAKKEPLRQRLLEKGTHSTTEFIISVQDQTRESLAGFDKFKQAGLESKLRELGLVNRTAYKVLKVTAKTKKDQG